MRSSSSRVTTSGIMISGSTSMPSASHLARGLEDRAHLHRVDLRVGDAEAATAVTEHGVELVQVDAPLLQLVERRSRSLWRAARSAPTRAAGTRAAADRAGEWSPAAPASPGRCRRSPSSGTGAAWRAPSRGSRRSLARIISHMARDALVVEEHVLGAAEADAFGAEVPRGARVERRVGVGAHLQLARLIGPGHELAELARERGGRRRHGAQVDAAASPPSSVMTSPALSAQRVLRCAPRRRRR